MEQALWYEWQSDQHGKVIARYSIPPELMHVYERVLQTIGRDYEGCGLDHDDIRIKSMPVLKNVFYQYAKERFYGTR